LRETQRAVEDPELVDRSREPTQGLVAAELERGRGERATVVGRAADERAVHVQDEPGTRFPDQRHVRPCAEFRRRHGIASTHMARYRPQWTKPVDALSNH
jgi:hypothetical protein